MFRSLCIVAAVVACASLAFGQNATGTIDGRVLDTTGSAVPGATVTIQNQATNVKQSIPTTSDGRFYQRYLLPGTYNLTVEKAGFDKYVQNGILLDVAQTISLDVSMRVGNVSTTVEVTANTAQLATESSTIATTVGGKAILDLPLGGNRNPLSLTTLVPGVVPAGNGSSTPWISGGRNDYNDVTIDGTSVIVPENNVSHLQIGYTPLEDSVAEFAVVTNALEPEYGRTGGGTINIATKSGTNEYHVDVFEFFRNNVLNANTWQNNRNGVARGVVRYNQFGGTFGGPVWIPKVYKGTNRTFFFVSEQSVRTPSAQAPLYSTPIDAWKQGNFASLVNGSGQPVAIYDPMTAAANSVCSTSQPTCYRSPFPGNVIPTSRFDPVAVNLMKFFPEPNNVPTNAFLQQNNFTRQGQSNSPVDQIDTRIDHNFSDKFRMFARGSNANSLSTDFNGLGNIGTPLGSGPSYGYSRNITVNAVYTLSPTTILNFNYGFARDVSIHTPFSQGTQPSSLGFPGYIDPVVDNFEFPQITITGNTAVGNSSGQVLGQASYTSLNDRPYSHIFRGDLTKIVGRHTFKMGGTWEKLFVNFTQLGSPDGQYSFSNGFTQQIVNGNNSTTQGNGFATFLLGLPSNNGNDLQFTYSAATASTYTGAYFQDDWKVTSKLTLNLGVRYDVDTPRTERYNRLSYFNINAVSPLQGLVQSSALCPNCGNLKGAMEFVGTSGAPYGRHQTPTDLNNWAPRIGFAYNMFQHTVIRGAYGILYAPSMLQAAGTSGTAGTEGFTGGTPLNTTFDNGATFVASLSNPFPTGFIRPLGKAAGPYSGTLTDIGATIQDSNFIDYVNPVVQQWNFNIQQEVKGNWIIQVGYLGSKGQHLPDGESSMTYDQLPASFLPLGSALNANVANPFYGVIQNPTSVYAQPTIKASLLLDTYPQYSGVNGFRKPQANSNYQSFIVSAEHRYKNGLTTLVSFTGGKLLDDASQVVTYIGQAGTKQDFYCRKCEKSVSSQDVSRRLVASATYEIPIGRGKKYFSGFPKAADFVLGGWQMNGIASFQTGIPLAISNGGNSTGLNSPGIRPTDNGQNPALSGAIADRLNEYFVQSAFSQTPNYAFGNVGRFLPNVRQPGLHNLDFSLFKNFKPIEKMMVQFRAEAFNLTNSMTWAAPGNNVASPGTFGVVNTENTSIASPNRTVQLGLKLYY
jgi:hypothetical protein